MPLPMGTPDLYNDMGLQYEENFAHDPGLISFIENDILPLTSPTATILDLGIGTGKPVAATLASAGRHIHGVDYSSTMLALSRKAVPSATLTESSILDFEPEPRGLQFDAAITSMSLFNFTHGEMKAVAGKVAGVVREGGYWFLVTIEQGKYGRNERVVGVGEGGVDEGARMVECDFLGRMVDILLYTEEGWGRLLEGAGFEVVRTRKEFFDMKGAGDDEPHYFIVARKK